jgi:hypothetical protein
LEEESVPALRGCIKDAKDVLSIAAYSFDPVDAFVDDMALKLFHIKN